MRRAGSGDGRAGSSDRAGGRRRRERHAASGFVQRFQAGRGERRAGGTKQRTRNGCKRYQKRQSRELDG